MEETSDTGIENIPCHQCSDIDLDRVFRGGYKMPHKIIDLGPVPRDQLRSPCPLCRLVAEAIYSPFGNPELASFHETCGFCTPYRERGVAEPGSYQLVAEVVKPETKRDSMGHGKMARYKDTYLTTNPIQQEAKSSKLEPQLGTESMDGTDLAPGEFVALKVAKTETSDSGFIAYYGSIYPAFDLAEAMAPARSLPISSLDWDLLRFYLRDCDDHHNECSSAVPQLQIQGFCLIDCHTRRLIPAAKGAKYVALSYVWGAPEKNTHMEVPELGEKLLQAPLVIEDAMDAVRELGHHYLWVDRFCILQSDSKSLRDHLANMHSIYQGASFTIIAAAGSDSSFGLPGVSSRAREPQAEATIDGCLLVSSVESFPGLLGCKWKSRAWTYQEELFSNRQLIFTSHQVSFHCLQSEHCEIYTSPAIIAPGVLNRTGNGTCSIWEHIERYSKRNLTYDSDSLNGLRATINSFTESAEKPVGSLWGIPFSETIAALDHDHPSGRAGTSSMMGMLSRARFASPSAVFGYSLTWKFLPREHQILRRRTQFPTWSWTSCVGEIEYPRLPWLTPDQPAMPDPELDISVLGSDGCCMPISAYFDASLEPSRYLHAKAWSVRDALTFNLAEGTALLDLGDTDNELKGFIQFDSIPTSDHKDKFETLSEAQNSQKRWEAIITYVAPGVGGANVPFVLILAMVEDAQYPDRMVYERIGCIPNLHLIWKPKATRRAARALGQQRRNPRPTMRWAAEIIEEQEKKVSRMQSGSTT
uniref:Heterokaryon incompatibility domain-containing protein n=1 Tax=Bionectria ochroleuca TaxID=29856 RepID=A0A8H7NLU0_BIOOC